ncbi:MAG: 5-oxoprolinase subunit PxpA [Bacteroidota bacterium]|nr:5-oxoprolinase subunit PxpA [Bacteroidota bacterium]
MLSVGRLSVDLNCDMGEGMEEDADIMPFISSANIACGYHAGDEETMRRTVDLALRHQVLVGAHPSFADRERFGRTDLLERAGSEETGRLLAGLAVQIADQLDLLQRICAQQGTRLHHMKPHGALYNRAAWDPVLGAIVCRAVQLFDPGIFIYGLSGSPLASIAERSGLRFVHEVFADRSYREDGKLTPRTEPNALIEDAGQAARQALVLVKDGVVKTTSGALIPLRAQTVCIHGDGPHAALFARSIREELLRNGFSIQAP